VQSDHWRLWDAKTLHNDTLCMSKPIFEELRDTTIYSFLRFIAHRYKSAPVKTGVHAIKVPESELCNQCRKPMTVRHRINSTFDCNVRVLWECAPCAATQWKDYGQGIAREKRGRRF
jgi:hypothetical protein